MKFKLTSENEQFVQEIVEQGEFDDESAVINEAMRLMQLRNRRIAELREQIREGMESGPGIPADEVFAHLEQRARELAERMRQPT